MKDKDELVEDMKNIQGGFDEVSQKISQARQEVMETRIKLGNGKIRPEELPKILDKIIDTLSPGAEQEIQGIIEDLYGLQGEIARE